MSNALYDKQAAIAAVSEYDGSPYYQVVYDTCTKAKYVHRRYQFLSKFHLDKFFAESDVVTTAQRDGLDVFRYQEAVLSTKRIRERELALEFAILSPQETRRNEPFYDDSTFIERGPPQFVTLAMLSLDASAINGDTGVDLQPDPQTNSSQVHSGETLSSQINSSETSNSPSMDDYTSLAQSSQYQTQAAHPAPATPLQHQQQPDELTASVHPQTPHPHASDPEHGYTTEQSYPDPLAEFVDPNAFETAARSLPPGDQPNMSAWQANLAQPNISDNVNDPEFGQQAAATSPQQIQAATCPPTNSSYTQGMQAIMVPFGSGSHAMSNTPNSVSRGYGSQPAAAAAPQPHANTPIYSAFSAPLTYGAPNDIFTPGGSYAPADQQVPGYGAYGELSGTLQHHGTRSSYQPSWSPYAQVPGPQAGPQANYPTTQAAHGPLHPALGMLHAYGQQARNVPQTGLGPQYSQAQEQPHVRQQSANIVPIRAANAHADPSRHNLHAGPKRISISSLLTADASDNVSGPIPTIRGEQGEGASVDGLARSSPAGRRSQAGREAEFPSALRNRPMSVPVKVPAKKSKRNDDEPKDHASDRQGAGVEESHQFGAPTRQPTKHGASQAEGGNSPFPEQAMTGHIRVSNGHDGVQEEEGESDENGDGDGDRPPKKMFKLNSGRAKSTGGRSHVSLGLDGIANGAILPRSIQEAVTAAETRRQRLSTQDQITQPGAGPRDLDAEFFEKTSFTARERKNKSRVRCLCGSRVDDAVEGEQWVECEGQGCGVWQHVLCMGEPAESAFKAAKAKKKAQYLCHLCDPWTHRKTVQKHRLGQAIP